MSAKRPMYVSQLPPDPNVVMPAIRGFFIEPMTGWWVVCEQCSDSELVQGSTAAADAVDWAQDHYHTVHRRPMGDVLDPLRDTVRKLRGKAGGK